MELSGSIEVPVKSYSEQSRQFPSITYQFFKVYNSDFTYKQRCHTQYDNFEKFGHARAFFDKKFRKEGVKSANWQQWQFEHLCISEDLDLEIEEFLPS